MLILFCAAIIIASVPQTATAQVVFSDDFDASPTTCSSLAPNWTTTDAILAEIGTFTANSNVCAAFTRGDSSNITSIPIDLSTATGADVSAWVRKGDDAFSEDPDSAAESLFVEILNATGDWVGIATLSATIIPDGGVTLLNVSVPASALHNAFQLRFRLGAGSGGPPENGGIGYDFWHIDDVVITQTAVPPPIPNPDLTANSCDDFEDGLFDNWTVTNATRSDVNTDAANSGVQSMFLRHDTVTSTSVIVNAPNLIEISAWIRRGSDTFNNRPEGAENLVFEYLNNVGAWVPLETFTGAGTAGEIFVRNFTAPVDARHSGLRVRFRLLAGSGIDFDYWHVDDLCFVSGAASIAINQTVSPFSDPVNGTLNPFFIPEAIAEYEITIENAGDGSVDEDTVVLRETIDPLTEMFVGDLSGGGSPFVIIDNPPLSGLTLNFGGLGSGGDGVVFRNSANAIITPTPPYDPDVASFELTFDGVFNASSGGTPSDIRIQYRSRVK